MDEGVQGLLTRCIAELTAYKDASRLGGNDKAQNDIPLRSQGPRLTRRLHPYRVACCHLHYCLAHGRPAADASAGPQAG